MVIHLVQSVVSLFYLAYMSYKDIKNRMINRNVIFSYIAVMVILGLFRNSFFELVISILPGLMLLLLSYITDEKIGYADGFIVLGIGAFLGVMGLIITLVGASIVLTMHNARYLFVNYINGTDINKEETVPLIPFLLVGMVVYYAVS